MFLVGLTARKQTEDLKKVMLDDEFFALPSSCFLSRCWNRIKTKCTAEKTIEWICWFCFEKSKRQQEPSRTVSLKELNDLVRQLIFLRLPLKRRLNSTKHYLFWKRHMCSCRWWPNEWRSRSINSRIWIEKIIEFIVWCFSLTLKKNTLEDDHLSFNDSMRSKVLK